MSIKFELDDSNLGEVMSNNTSNLDNDAILPIYIYISIYLFIYVYIKLLVSKLTKIEKMVKNCTFNSVKVQFNKIKV